MNKKVIITGASGLIGRQLFKELLNRGDEITIFARDPASAKQQLPGAKDYVKWDYLELDPWQKMVDGKNAIIHLAGANISGKRWTEKYKKEILESRIISTQNLIKAIGNSNNKPECFIISSAVGYYGDAGNETLTEASPSGNDFLSKVCTKWELESHKVDELGIRRVNVRTGVVISADGGALKKMLLPFKFFVGGPLGNGKQWFPWIHIDDITRIYIDALDNTKIKGPINAAAPGIVSMKEFSKKLGNTLNRPSIFSVPKVILRLVIGKVTESVLASQRVVPKTLLDSGFKFKFENIQEALRDLLNG
jgi:uncharacterized protein (TIGR01777 family)